MEDIYARFNPNPTKIAAWTQLLMLESCHNALTPPPDVLYSRAIPTFLQWRDNLVKLGWIKVPDDHLPPGLLFVVESPPCDAISSGGLLALSPSSSSDSIYGDSSSFQTTVKPIGTTRFALPAELSAFLEYREEIQESLRNPALFKPVLDRRDNLVLATPDESDALSAAIFRDTFYLLQLIVPGMFLLIQDALSFSHKKKDTRPLFAPGRHNRRPHQDGSRDGDYFDSTASPRILLRRTRRALPPAEWIMTTSETLEIIFGKHLLHELISCARDVELTVWRTVHGPDGDPLDSGSDAGFEPPMSPVDDWSDLEESAIPGSIAIPSVPHTRYSGSTRRAHSL